MAGGDDAKVAGRLLDTGERLRKQCRELRESVAAMAGGGEALERDCADHLRNAGSLRRRISKAANELSRLQGDIQRLPPPAARRLRAHILAAHRTMQNTARSYTELADKLSSLLESAGQRLRDVEKGQRVLQRYRKGAS